MSSSFSVGGLASGLDTSSIIQQLIALERQPILRLEARKQVEEGEISAFTDLTTKLSAVRSALDDIDKAIDFAAFRTATSSDETVATATAESGAQPSSTSFSVLRLAQTHQVRDSSGYADGDTAYGDGTLSIDLGDGTVHDVDTTGKTLSQVFQEVGDLDGVSASIVGLTDGDHLVISAEDSGADGAFTVTFDGSDARFTGNVIQGQDALVDLDGDAGTTDDQATSATNAFTDFLQNVTIDVKSLGSTTVTVDHDATGAADSIESLVTAINELFSKADSLTAFGGEDGTNGPLIGSATVRDLVNQIRNALTRSIGDSATFPTAGSVGVSLTREGGVELDRGALEEALAADFEEVVTLFAGIAATADTTETTASSDSEFVTFSSLTDATQDGSYNVVVNSAAQPATVQGTSYTLTNSNNERSTYRVTIGGTSADLGIQFDANASYVAYDQGTNPGTDAVATTDAEVVQIVQDFLDANFGAGSHTVTDIDTSGAVRVKIEDSDLTDSLSVSLVDGSDHLGLDGASGAPADADVTIDGTTMTASGNTVTAPAGHAAEGLELLIDPSTADGHSATVTVSTTTTPGDPGQDGLADFLDDALGAFEGTDGRIETEKDRRESTIDLYDDRIESLERRIEIRESSLRRQFAAMETALSTMQNQLDAFMGQLASLN